MKNEETDIDRFFFFIAKIILNDKHEKLTVLARANVLESFRRTAVWVIWTETLVVRSLFAWRIENCVCRREEVHLDTVFFRRPTVF